MFAFFPHKRNGSINEVSITAEILLRFLHTGMNGSFTTQSKDVISLETNSVSIQNFTYRLSKLYQLFTETFLSFYVTSLVSCKNTNSLNFIETFVLFHTWSVQQSLQMLHLWLPMQLPSSSEIQLFAKYLLELERYGHRWLSAKKKWHVRVIIKIRNKFLVLSLCSAPHIKQWNITSQQAKISLQLYILNPNYHWS